MSAALAVTAACGPIELDPLEPGEPAETSEPAETKSDAPCNEDPILIPAAAWCRFGGYDDDDFAMVAPAPGYQQIELIAHDAGPAVAELLEDQTFVDDDFDGRWLDFNAQGWTRGDSGDCHHITFTYEASQCVRSLNNGPVVGAVRVTAECDEFVLRFDDAILCAVERVSAR